MSFLFRYLPKPPTKTSGYTLIELLVVIVMVGILAAIAAPSWTSWRNNQWLGNARGQITEAIRKTQSEAKLKKIDYSLVFDRGNDPLFGNSGRVRYAIVPTAVPLEQINNWTIIGGSNIPASGIGLRTTTVAVPQPGGGTRQEPRLAFDTYGTFAVTDRSAKAENAALFIAQISIGKGDPQKSARRCVILTSLLGSLRDAESAKCTLPN